jgi:hypothetical protein
MINEIENIIRYDHITICTTITSVYLHCNDRVDKVNGQDPACTGRDQCSCVTSDGKVIDLSSIGKTDGTAA